MEELEFSIKPDFVIPFGNIIYLLKSSSLYKIFNKECVWSHLRIKTDSKYIFILNGGYLIRIEAITTEIDILKIPLNSGYLAINDKHVVIYDNSNGLIFIDKHEFSNFKAERVDWNISAIGAFGDSVSYLGFETIINQTFSNNNISNKDSSMNISKGYFYELLLKFYDTKNDSFNDLALLTKINKEKNLEDELQAMANKEDSEEDYISHSTTSEKEEVLSNFQNKKLEILGFFNKYSEDSLTTEDSSSEVYFKEELQNKNVEQYLSKIENFNKEIENNNKKNKFINPNNRKDLEYDSKKKL